ncbi:MAG: hypothetical protein NTW48_08140 [Chloroflexi bacterium]|nr:hypothetical protein [Chloroflexota bacterium]
MKKCRICKTKIPEQYEYCTYCGANQSTNLNQQATKHSVFASLKDWFGNLFRDEEIDRRLDRVCMASLEEHDDASLNEMEIIARLKPKNRNLQSILAWSYSEAADERLGFRGPPGLFRYLRPDERGKATALSILSCICEVELTATLSEITNSRSHFSLNEALNDAITLYGKSIRVMPEEPKFYISRARAFQRLADGILMAFGIFHNYESPYTKVAEDGTFTVGSICLGRLSNYSSNVSIPVDLGAKVIWFYRHAEADYLKSLELDPTSVETYLSISHVQRQQGKTNEANSNRDRAFELVNKAINADTSDCESYFLRADIYEEIGGFALAIADIEKAITLSPSELRLIGIKHRLEELRKSSSQNQIQIN